VTRPDVDAIRARFPALAAVGDWALFDNAGGSVPVRGVIERLTRYVSTCSVQLGASYEVSRRAGELVRAGRNAAARLVNADVDEVVLGPSSTVLVQLLARALGPTMAPGDEVVVTDLDHEANIGPWIRLREKGIVVREWKLRPESATLHLDDLAELLGPRTRLVACTQAANVVGEILDIAAIARRVHEAGALLVADGVAYAAHRRVDVKALDVDFYCVSLYKVFGPHVGLLYGRRELLRRARGQNHFFVGEDEVPYKLEPGAPSHELVASLPGVLEHLAFLAGESGAVPGPEALERAFALVAERERDLMRPLLAFLAAHPRVRLLGTTDDAIERRVPTLAFAVRGRSSSEIPPLLDERRVAVRYGHFYAHRAMQALGLLEQEGVVRVSLLHYNTADEVVRLIDALDAVL